MLPVMTKPADASAVATYLNTKVTGASLQDAKATLDKRLLDGRKIAAYIAWGLVSRDEDKLRLTQLGRRLARASDGDQTAVFAEIILAIRAYRLAAEWIHYGPTAVVNLTELAAHWFDNIPGDLGTTADTTIRLQASCFMGVAEAAGLGKFFFGRRGQPSRLQVDRARLSRLFARAEFSTDPSAPSGPTTEDPEESSIDSEHEEQQGALEAADQTPSMDTGRELSDDASSKAPQVRKSSQKPLKHPEPKVQQAQVRSRIDDQNSLGMPETRLSIEIRIDASVTPEQIDLIFMSMAKHLYGRDHG